MVADKILIRQEERQDYETVIHVVRMAFHGLVISNQTEHLIVERLRRSNAFIPELSIVATMDKIIVGHILLSKIKIKKKNTVHTILSLAPISILPKYQRRGIGSKLINHAHELGAKLGYTACLLIGHASYYPRFGYEKAHKFDITFPFEVNPESSMVKELISDGLKGISGRVEYPKEFFE